MTWQLGWLNGNSYYKHTQITPCNVKQAIKPLQDYFLAVSTNQPQETLSMLDAWKFDQKPPRPILYYFDWMFTGCDAWQLWTLPLLVHSVLCCVTMTHFSSVHNQFSFFNTFGKSVTILNCVLYHRWWDLACGWQWHSVECCSITCNHQSLQCQISSWWCRLDCFLQWDCSGSWRCWRRWGCCDPNSCWAQLWPSDENWKHKIWSRLGAALIFMDLWLCYM